MQILYSRSEIDGAWRPKFRLKRDVWVSTKYTFLRRPTIQPTFSYNINKKKATIGKQLCFKAMSKCCTLIDRGQYVFKLSLWCSPRILPSCQILWPSVDLFVILGLNTKSTYSNKQYHGYHSAIGPRGFIYLYCIQWPGNKFSKPP